MDVDGAARNDPAAEDETDLLGELRRLEELARNARTASGAPVSRSLLARESGVPEDTLAAWFERGSSPQDGGELLAVVRVLSVWAGQDTPSGTHWPAELPGDEPRISAAPKNGTDAAPKKDKRLTRRAKWAMGTVVTGCLLAVGGGLYNLVTSGVTPATSTPSAGTSATGATSTPAAVEGLQANADWCCRYTSVVASTGFYWPGSAARLSTALRTARSGVSVSALMPAGLGLIEIPLQTSGTEPIDVAPPKVIVRSRTPNLTHGIIAILPRGEQGTGSPAEFEADVDDAEPGLRQPFTLDWSGPDGLSGALADIMLSR
jgi:hypothetical protein